MDKGRKQTLELVRVAATAVIATGAGLMKVVKGKQDPALFGLGVAAALTALAVAVKDYVNEDGSDEPQDQPE